MKLNLQAAIDGKIDEQLNLALCEWLGWAPWSAENVGAAARLFNGDVWYRLPHEDTIATPAQIPNHISAPESLGLVHEVETTLTTKQQLFYQGNLSIVSGNSKTPGQWYNIHATARQRVIAILQTVKPEIFE